MGDSTRPRHLGILRPAQLQELGRTVRAAGLHELFELKMIRDTISGLQDCRIVAVVLTSDQLTRFAFASYLGHKRYEPNANGMIVEVRPGRTLPRDTPGPLEWSEVMDEFRAWIARVYDDQTAEDFRSILAGAPVSEDPPFSREEADELRRGLRALEADILARLDLHADELAAVRKRVQMLSNQLETQTRGEWRKLASEAAGGFSEILGKEFARALLRIAPVAAAAIF